MDRISDGIHNPLIRPIKTKRAVCSSIRTQERRKTSIGVRGTIGWAQLSPLVHDNLIPSPHLTLSFLSRAHELQKVIWKDDPTRDLPAGPPNPTVSNTRTFFLYSATPRRSHGTVSLPRTACSAGPTQLRAIRRLSSSSPLRWALSLAASGEAGAALSLLLPLLLASSRLQSLLWTGPIERESTIASFDDFALFFRLTDCFVCLACLWWPNERLSSVWIECYLKLTSPIHLCLWILPPLACFVDQNPIFLCLCSLNLLQSDLSLLSLFWSWIHSVQSNFGRSDRERRQMQRKAPLEGSCSLHSWDRRISTMDTNRIPMAPLSTVESLHISTEWSR